MKTDIAKRAAAAQALEYVSPGMKLGIGAGSTVERFIELLGEKAREEGWALTCVGASRRTEELAQAAGLVISDLNDVGWLDLVIDGADEIDEDLRMIKGGGGALLREKILATSAEEMLIIADSSKMVETLGAYRLPVEVVQFAWRMTKTQIEEGLSDFDVAEDVEGALRMDGDMPFVTDEGHYILDFALEEIGDPEDLAEFLVGVPGVVEHGLFLDIATRAVIGDANGDVEIVELEEVDPEEWEDD